MYLRRYLLIRVILPCVGKKFGEGGMPLAMAIMQTCLSSCRGGVQHFVHDKDTCDAWWSVSSLIPELHHQVNCHYVVLGINDKLVVNVG